MIGARVQLSTHSGQVVASTDSEVSDTIDSSSSELVKLNQTTEGLKLGPTHCLIAESNDGEIVCSSQIERPNGPALISTAVATSVDDVLLATSIVKNVVAQMVAQPTPEPAAQ